MRILNNRAKPISPIRPVRPDFGSSWCQHLMTKPLDDRTIVLVVVENIYVRRRCKNQVYGVTRDVSRTRISVNHLDGSGVRGKPSNARPKSSESLFQIPRT